MMDTTRQKRMVLAVALVASCGPTSAGPVTRGEVDASAPAAGVAGASGAAGSPGSGGGGGGGGGGSVGPADAGAAAGAGGGRPDAGGVGGAVGRDAPAGPDAPALPDAPAAEARTVPDRRQLADGEFIYPQLDGKLCGSDEYTLIAPTVDVLLLLDRSGSMDGAFGGGTKWAAAAAAAKATLMSSANLRWGLKLFPTGASNCGASATVEVPIAAGNAPALRMAIDGAGPPMGTLGNGTPTTLTMNAAVAYLKGLASPERKYIVLATDGAPTCLEGNGAARDEARAIAAVAAAAAAGFKTFVIGISTAAADVDVLDQMADAGGAARPGATRYYPAGSPAELMSALDAITSALVPCEFPLANRPLDPGFVAVTVDSRLIPRDPSRKEGWDYTAGGMAVQIYGAACEQLKKGTARKAGIFFGCPF